MQTWIYGLVITSGAYLENVRSSEKCSMFVLITEFYRPTCSYSIKVIMIDLT